MIEVIDNHSVRTDLLTKGPVLDAGARGFVFSKWFSDKGHETFACDPSQDIEFPTFLTHYARVALIGKNVNRYVCHLQTTGDPGAWFVQEKGQGEHIEAWTIDNFRWSEWDVIKLNIEGSEYGVLETWPGPIARQIVVSFHEHTPRARGRSECDRLIEKMRQWYTPFNVVWEERYCCTGKNYWDVLFIRNDLV